LITCHVACFGLREPGECSGADGHFQGFGICRQSCSVFRAYSSVKLLSIQYNRELIAFSGWHVARILASLYVTHQIGGSVESLRLTSPGCIESRRLLIVECDTIYNACLLSFLLQRIQTAHTWCQSGRCASTRRTACKSARDLGRIAASTGWRIATNE
jgi:hypothetical protein